MGALSSEDMLALWERGAALHPLDRVLALCRMCGINRDPAQVPDLPLGAVNMALLALRRENFGARLAAQTDCTRCQTRLELALDLNAVMASLEAREVADGADRTCGALRAPTLRDLAAVAAATDTEEAALMLWQRCSLEQPGAAALSRAEAERQLDLLDPAADIALTLSCDQCGHAWVQSLDVGALVWEEVSAGAARLLADVHRLAQTYGWSEREILALTPQRRAAYLALCLQ
jgi:hypothetical protein